MQSIKDYEIGELYFGQLHPRHQDFFGKLNCQHTRVKLRDLPHYTLWRDQQWEKPKTSLYHDYLKASWAYYQPHKNTQRDRYNRIEAYFKLRQNIINNGVKDPVEIVVCPDGAKVIVSGNHRAAIAYNIGIDLPYKAVDLNHYLRQIISNDDEFYGTKNRGIPYQSIFYKKAELIKGRRRDVLERFQKMSITDDIRGKDVLDVGANIGVNSMLAWQFGAKRVIAAEYSASIATAALRLSTLFDSQIGVQVQDMGKPMTDKHIYDTVLCFSLYTHVKDKKQFEKNLVKKTGRALYFEGHERTVRADYNHIFRHFSNVELLGFNKDGVHSRKSTRPFFRCEK